jgi:hypothetical protein
MVGACYQDTVCFISIAKVVSPSRIPESSFQYSNFPSLARASIDTGKDSSNRGINASLHLKAKRAGNADHSTWRAPSLVPPLVRLSGAHIITLLVLQCMKDM